MARRRSYGTGSLRCLGGDRYRFECRAEDGTRLSRVFTARNATEANKATGDVRRELLEAHERRQDTAGVERDRRQQWTVGRYADFYLEKWASVHLAITTRRRYRIVIETNIKPYIGDVRMADVTPTTLQGLYVKLGGKGSKKRGGDDPLAGPSIWLVHSVMRALFAFAVDVQQDFTVNPAASKAARPPFPRTGASKRAVDVAEVERFVALAVREAPEIAVPVMLSAWLGTRRSETLALQWRDVDLKAREVIVRRSVTQTPEDGVVVKETTKTGRVRTVPVDENTAAELDRVRREQLQRRIARGRMWLGGATPERDWVCAGPDGSMTTPNAFESAFRALTDRHKVSLTPHLLRHAFVSQLIAAGYDAVTISAMTGHSPDVLLRTYAHAFDGRKRQAIADLSAQREAARAAL